MRQRIHPGAEIDAATPQEIDALIAKYQREDDRTTRIRARSNVTLDANGNGIFDVYKVPLGDLFKLHRCTLTISTASDPYTNNVPFAAGVYVAYLRSGSLIEFGIPLASTALVQVPGVQTWIGEEGPTLRNGEVFQIRAAGLTANADLICTIEGVLHNKDAVR